MGEGDPELGKLLMETFVDNLKLQEHLPTHVVMYNGGVKLAMKASPVCSSLSELEELGCRIMLCGTCIDHYGLQYEIGVGMISNMVSHHRNTGSNRSCHLSLIAGQIEKNPLIF